MYRVAKALSTSQFYPEIISDGRKMTKTFFATTLLLWFILWSVKFAFLMLYRRLFSGIKFYVRLWWLVVVFCGITLVGCVVTNFTSCQSMSAWFNPGACSTPRDVKAQTISLYFSFAVDVITDLMSMSYRMISRRSISLIKPFSSHVHASGPYLEPSTSSESEDWHRRFVLHWLGVYRSSNHPSGVYRCQIWKLFHAIIYLAGILGDY